MDEKKTLVVGASPNRFRYAHKAVIMLHNLGVKVIPLGIKKGKIGNIPIMLEKEMIPNIHTVALYINPTRQEEYYEYIIRLKPKRLIFNPGTENPEFQKLALKNGIDAINSCVLILINSNRY